MLSFTKIAKINFVFLRLVFFTLTSCSLAHAVEKIGNYHSGHKEFCVWKDQKEVFNREC
jgi:hypothetical protein